MVEVPLFPQAVDPLYSKPPWSKGAGINQFCDLVRLVATLEPANPSQTLILLAVDEVDIVTYSACQPARLEYSFGEHTFAIPQTTDGLEIMQTLMGPSAIRLTAATDHQTLAVLRVRMDGRALLTLLYGR